MKTLREPEWKNILIVNLSRALDMCMEAGIEVLDDDDKSYKLGVIYQDPRTGTCSFSTTHIDEKEEVAV